MALFARVGRTKLHMGSQTGHSELIGVDEEPWSAEP
jgi:hypothetical protein